MSEVPPPPEASQNPEAPKSDFKPGEVIHDETLFRDMREGRLGSPAKKMALLHQMGVLDRLDSDELSQRAKTWADEIGEEGKQDEQIWVDYADRVAPLIQKRLETLDKKTSEEPLPLPGSKVGDELIAGVVGTGVGYLAGKAREGVGKAFNAAQSTLGKGEKAGTDPSKYGSAVTQGEGGSGGEGGNGGNVGGPENEKSPDNESFKFIQGEILNLEEKLKESVDLKEKGEIRKKLDALKEKRERFYKEADNLGLFDGIREGIVRIAKKSPWNDVHTNILKEKEQLASSFYLRRGYKENMDGMAEAAIEGAADEIKMLGYSRKMKNGAWDQDFLDKHGESNESLYRLFDRVKYTSFMQLPPNIEDYVDWEREQKNTIDPTYRKAGGVVEDDGRLAELARSMGDERYVPIQAPKHVGAVFVGGLFEKMFRHETIPPCDITTAAGREKFILENIHAFDYLLQEPGAWKGAVGAWLDDMYFASKSAANVIKFGENPENAGKRFEDVISEFEAKVKAMMAVTASARAMEKSNGSIEAYGVWLTTGGQGKEADLDIQDQYKDYILHDDPKKLDLVLENPLVRKYFRQITSDMGARTITTDKKKGTRRYYRTKEIEDIRKGGNSCRLVEYLKNGAEKGGFLSYIEKEILGSENRGSPDWDTKLAAARLASDLIMVDGTYTQWEYEITNGKNGEQAIRAQYSSQATAANQAWVDRKVKLWEDLKLFPIKNYGGDPLRSLKEASYLHLKIKGVYRDELGREIMADLDRAMRPTHIFKSPTLDTKKIAKGELTRESYELGHTMAEGWKRLARWGRAGWILVGGSQAEKLGVFSRETAEELKVIALRLNEVYGGITEEFDKNDPRNTTLLRRYPDGKYPLGKHMVGKMMAEIFKLKAKAYTAQRQRAGVFDRISQTMGDIKTHPNYEILAMLWGPDVDAKSGVRADLAGSELQLIFKGNDFGAYDDLLATKAILETGDPHATATSGRTARAMGRGIGGIFRSFAGGGKR